MDVAQSLDVIAKYRALLNTDPEVANMDEFPSREGQRKHLVHMLDHMEEMLDSKKYPVTNWDKFNRWLGFVQGCLWNLREHTLNEMREHNMRPAKKFGTGAMMPEEWMGKTPAEIQELRKKG